MMDCMQLKELIRELASVSVEGSVDREIAGLTYDSRRVTPGMVFVAIPGQNVDGHEYIGTAVERGASAVICEQNGIVAPRVTRIRVPDSREALARAAATFYEHPSQQLKVIGVTGTNGKTTVAFMVKQILEGAGIRTGLLGTVRYEIGERIIPAQRTTPEALDIQDMLAQMVRAGCGACVMEVSSHALEQKRVQEVRFDVVAFTNLTQDHLDYHGTMESYYQAKRKLFLKSGENDKSLTAVINLDDPFGVRLSRESIQDARITYGVLQPARIGASKIQLSREGSRLVVEIDQKRLTWQIPLIGRHNVYNVLAAAGTAMALGVEPARIQQAVAHLQPVPGRLEGVSSGQPFGVYVDYAHTDDALRNVLRTLREITSGRLLLTFGCGGNRDLGKRFKMGRAAAQLADFTLITSDNPRRESPADIAAHIESGYCAVRDDNYRVELDRRRAIDEIIRQARPGDVVLIAGKGHETYQEFEDTIVPFDDRSYARETLESLGYLERTATG
jgi:UDP-N-acetylmuramoyl-L-alanyl-D-glutamate--2,6-diaminopimelate ligase